MLEHRQFDSLSRSESLHDGCILISDILFNDSFDRFYFVKSVIKSDDLTDELGSLRHQTLVNSLVDSIKAVPESIIN